ncbi:MMPL family transporter [Bacillus thuringiensis]|uniref:MMPL family transporter n=1 Tax=Bacillus thuringiensis TaxID=1428 RepID=UPI000E52B005|nr:MMPL family transporter [Bacillus thuringiensis]MDZ3956913.1 MMPL family transporter [Bacillus thuringiensis]RGP42346.1 hypothetical protein BTW32_31265 [Bacillus thuringiensis]
MGKFKSWRIVSLLVWIIVASVILVTMPDLEKLVRDKGQVEIPYSAQSEVAKRMLNTMKENGEDAFEVIAVYNSGNKQPITDNQQNQITSVIQRLKKQEKKLGIEEIKSFLDNEELKKQLISKDHTTILIPITIKKNQRTMAEVTSKLEQEMKIDNMKMYLTGNELIMEDFITSTQEGVHKTEIIAIIFIIAVLILIFRSPIIPAISLLTVGLSYFISMGVIAHLVDTFNYPFSNFTQVLLIVVLFGIGTDYNILLFTRFKEELTIQEDTYLAVKATYKAAGKTIVYSSIAVFIGFIALIMAEFQVYRATSAVAIGVAVLLLVLMTLNPVFMIGLGNKMFWPVKNLEGHKNNRIWGAFAKYAVTKPIFVMIVVMVLCIPIALQYTGVLNYNDLLEVDDSFSSKKGVKVIEQHFSAGFSSPVTVVMQGNEKWDTPMNLKLLDELAVTMSNIKGVSGVYSSTRPAGEEIKELYIYDQAKELQTGLGDAKNGIGEINNGLSNAGEQLENHDSADLANVKKLVAGTEEAKNGVVAIGKAVGQINQGMENGAHGAGVIENGIADLRGNVEKVSYSMKELQAGYTQVANGLNAQDEKFKQLQNAIEGVKKGYVQIENMTIKLIETHPEMKEDQNVQQILGITNTMKQQLDVLLHNVKEMIPSFQTAMNAFGEANQTFKQINEGFSQVANGAQRLQEGASTLGSSLGEGKQGSTVLTQKLNEIGTGLTQINGGQKELVVGLDNLQKQMKELKSGMSKSTEGLESVNEGLSSAQKYLQKLGESPASKVFYIPQEMVGNQTFQQGLNMYMSKNRKMTQMTVMLDVDPYSEKAMPIVQNINQQMNNELTSSVLKNVQITIGGQSSKNVELKNISSNDFLRTAAIMLCGIGIILICITRSIWQPIMIIGALVLTYYVSLGLSELISKYVLGVEHVSWNVPFFSFIMIVALGVDYSIFFLMRYRESGEHLGTALIESACHIGGVVISAAIILGGTFAALIPSGVLSLVQVAMTVIIGLSVLSLIMLPLLLPALMSLVYRFYREGNIEAIQDENIDM